MFYNINTYFYFNLQNISNNSIIILNYSMDSITDDYTRVALTKL